LRASNGVKATTAKTAPITAASCLLYGIGDNYHPQNSHVIPALIRPLHKAKINEASVVSIWGTGALCMFSGSAEYLGAPSIWERRAPARQKGGGGECRAGAQRSQLKKSMFSCKKVLYLIV
jgi:hypothetical protein